MAKPSRSAASTSGGPASRKHLLAFARDESSSKTGPFRTRNVPAVRGDQHALPRRDTHLFGGPAVDGPLGLEFARLFDAQHAL